MESDTNIEALREEALKKCDRDPIHTPGMIQGFGCMLAYDIHDHNLCYVSANCSDYLEISASEILLSLIHI